MQILFKPKMGSEAYAEANGSGEYPDAPEKCPICGRTVNASGVLRSAQSMWQRLTIPQKRQSAVFPLTDNIICRQVLLLGS